MTIGLLSLVVHLDLKSNTFTKNKKLHQRTIQNLQKQLQTFTVIISWEPYDSKICPSSIAKYFTERDNTVTVCSPQIQTRTKYLLHVPMFCDDLENSCDPKELIEWLGMFTLNGDCENGKPDSYTNTYEVPEPNKLLGQVQYFESRGFFTTQKLETFLEELRNYVSKNEAIPWISLYVQGFSDSPIAWGLQEHHYFTNGDNAYIIFITPSGKYLLGSQKCTNKRHK